MFYSDRRRLSLFKYRTNTVIVMNNQLYVVWFTYSKNEPILCSGFDMRSSCILCSAPSIPEVMDCIERNYPGSLVSVIPHISAVHLTGFVDDEPSMIARAKKHAMLCPKSVVIVSIFAE